MVEKTGWVIRSARPFKHPATGEPLVSVSWWYGPTHGWGNTWGSAELAETFKTRKAAEEAHAKLYGRSWRNDRLRSAVKSAQRFADAMAESNAKREAVKA